MLYGSSYKLLVFWCILHMRRSFDTNISRTCHSLFGCNSCTCCCRGRRRQPKNPSATRPPPHRSIVTSRVPQSGVSNRLHAAVDVGVPVLSSSRGGQQVSALLPLLSDSAQPEVTGPVLTLHQSAFRKVIALFLPLLFSLTISRSACVRRATTRQANPHLDAPHWRTGHDKLKIQAGGLDLRSTHEKSAMKWRRTTVREIVHWRFSVRVVSPHQPLKLRWFYNTSQGVDSAHICIQYI